MTAPAMDVPIARKDWFYHLFGCRKDSVDITVALELQGLDLVSKVNGARYGAGRFSTPSLAELRAAAEASNLPAGPLEIAHVATSDIFELHTHNEYRGAVFQAASQFNCLEFAHPEALPEHGVTGYIYDGTQGPACSLAAPAATVARNYFVLTKGEPGQMCDRQLNMLGELLMAVQGTDGEGVARDPAESPPKRSKSASVGKEGGESNLSSKAKDKQLGITAFFKPRAAADAVETTSCATSVASASASSSPGRDLIQVRNRYTSSDNARLRDFNRVLRESWSGAAREALLGKLQIGLHSGVEVPWGPKRFVLRPPEHRQHVTQAFCSALACGYSDGSLSEWAHTRIPQHALAFSPFALAIRSLMLTHTMLTHTMPGDVLTFLGGGVFGNREEWIEGAIARACVRLGAVGLRVVCCHHGRVDERLVRRLRKAMERERPAEDRPRSSSS